MIKEIIVLLILIFTAGIATAEPDFFSVGLNNTGVPDTLEDQEGQKNGFYSTGLIVPEHLQNSYYAVPVYDHGYTESGDLPSKWDWRSKSGVTPVKDQEKCGSCFAFGTVGMIESYIKIHNGQVYDLSEEQAKNCIWESTGCKGGCVQWVINPLTQNGIVLEQDYPYHPTNGLCNNIRPTLRVTEWNLLSTEKALDVNTLKRYIMNEGPVVTSLIVQGWNKSYNGSYVLSADKEGKNHAVVIVGWNDSIADKNVSGHWIFKNSWGTEWGDNGYGYIEYDTAKIGTHVSIIDGYEDYDHSVHTINYDDAGWNDAFGAYGFDRIRGLVIHYVNTDTEILGIEFWTTGMTPDVDLYLYDDFDGKKLGNLLYSHENLSYAEPGYHSIKITESIKTPTGKIVVVANIQNTDCVYFDDKVAPIAIDVKGPCETNKCYVSIGDRDHKWYDQWYTTNKLKMADGSYHGGDIALRLRVSGEPVPLCEYIFLETDGFVRNVTVGKQLKLDVKCVDQYGDYVECPSLTWSSSNKSVATALDYILKAREVGTTTISVHGDCNNKNSNSINITVIPEKLYPENYLSEEEFKDRMADLQKQIDEMDNQSTDDLQAIFDKINSTYDSGNTIIRVPPDAVSPDTFNEMMDDLQKQIDEMKSRSRTLFQKIMDYLDSL